MSECEVCGWEETERGELRDVENFGKGRLDEFRLLCPACYMLAKNATEHGRQRGGAQ